MFQNGVDLKQYSNYKIGGPARQFYVAKNVDDVKKAVEKARKEKSPIFILGGGTNLLISDKGFDGLVLKPEIDKLEIETKETKKLDKEILVTVGTGVLMSDFLNFLISHSLSGLEWAGGLPGTVGGAIRGNAGAFGGETKDSIVEVVSLDISEPQAQTSRIKRGLTRTTSGPKVTKRNNAECQFGYRNSIFKINDGKEIVLEATFVLKKGDKKAIRRAIEEKIKYRKEHQPLEYPNIGSIFKNVNLRLVPKKLHGELAHVIKTDPFPVVPTAHLISECGLKGVSWGGAMISPKHPNFIVNVLDAKAEDVKTLIKLVKTAVKEKFGVRLEEEVIYVGGFRV